jgi:RHS repeat-associated protein
VAFAAAPGEGFFVRSALVSQILAPDPNLALCYYHEDHLGSLSCLTDANGGIVKETANYAFGVPRIQNQKRGQPEPYSFTQKETDAETELANFETRNYVATIARFARADPLIGNPPKGWFVQPQKQNCYGYCGNRPIVVVDPNGTDGTEAETSAPKNSESKDHKQKAEDEEAKAGKTLVDTTKEAVEKGTEEGVKMSKRSLRKMGINKDNMKSMGKVAKNAGKVLKVYDAYNIAKACKDVATEGRVTKECAKEIAGFTANHLASKGTFVGCEAIAAALTEGIGAVAALTVCGAGSSVAGSVAEEETKKLVEKYYPDDPPPPPPKPMPPKICKP